MILIYEVNIFVIDKNNYIKVILKQLIKPK